MATDTDTTPPTPDVAASVSDRLTEALLEGDVETAAEKHRELTRFFEGRGYNE